mmetsp:Transcript_21948/g.51874  ORF Transcript_21948/g.51874 Transcript_21948/m.51874 type:complete len:409 (+) Transcript_21948:429-1655(+)
MANAPAVVHLLGRCSRSVRIRVLLLDLFLLLLLLLAIVRALLVAVRLLLLLLLLRLLLLLLRVRVLLLPLFLLWLLLNLHLRRARNLRACQLLVHLVPAARGLLVGPPVLVQLPLNNHLLLRLGLRTEPPSPGVGVALHDDSLDLGDDAMVAGGHHGRRHLRDAEADCLALGGDHDNLGPDFNAVLEAQQAGDHELRAVADGVDRTVLDHHALVRDEKALEREDHAAQVRLVLVRVEGPLGIEHVMHRHQVVRLRQRTRPHAPQLLHVPAHAEQQPEMHAHRSHVRACLAADPEDPQVALHVVLNHLALVDGADSQLALHSRDEGGALEDRSLQPLQGLRELALALNRPVQPRDRDILLSCALLRLDEACRPLDTHNQAACHFGIKRSTVASLLDAENTPDPRNYLMR